tara:strand:+ start:1129 stop:2112 length:984 start_codon:yes stop_codon:yes gene_type:complete
MPNEIKILRRKLLHDNFLFIDGMSKSGKIVISSIVSTLKNCENQLYTGQFNNYLKFSNLNLLEENLAVDLILQEMQILMIENHLARFLNFRKYDLSSVNNSLKKKIYYDRLKIKDNPNEIKKIINNLKKNKDLIPLIVDDFFPSCKAKFKYFYRFKKIIMLRNPVGILYENLKRSRLDKQIKGHPWQRMFYYKKNNFKVPWFVNSKYVNKFFSSNRIEKYLMFMNSEYHPYLNQNVFKIKNTLYLFLEDIWENPKQGVKLISKFLKKNPTNHTKKILKALDLPRRNTKKIYEKQYYYLKSIMSKSEFKIILNMEKNYLNRRKTYGFK